jgi:hypothetical protein
MHKQPDWERDREQSMRTVTVSNVPQIACAPRGFAIQGAVKNCYQPQKHWMAVAHNSSAIDTCRSVPYPPDTGLRQGDRLFRGRTA